MPPKKDNQEILSAISNLAQATGKGFDDVRKEFGKVHVKLADMTQQLERIERIVLQDHQRRLETIEHKLGIR
jgi:hypothetical protein